MNSYCQFLQFNVSHLSQATFTASDFGLSITELLLRFINALGEISVGQVYCFALKASNCQFLQGLDEEERVLRLSHHFAG
jgi:hypothetical protein